MKQFKLYDYHSLVDFSDYEPLTVKQAILAKCYECNAWDSSETKACTNKMCPLYQYKVKWWKKVCKPTELTDEQRKEIAARLNYNK